MLTVTRRAAAKFWLLLMGQVTLFSMKAFKNVKSQSVLHSQREPNAARPVMSQDLTLCATFTAIFSLYSFVWTIVARSFFCKEQSTAAHLLQASVPDISEGKARLQEAELIPPLGRKMTVDHQCTELEGTSINGGLRLYSRLVSIFRDWVMARVVAHICSGSRWLVWELLVRMFSGMTSHHSDAERTHFWQVYL